MALRGGTHTVGPDDGTLRVHTYREGVAQKVGHDLILEVQRWQGTVEVGEDGALSAIGLEADPRSLRVREGLRGLKPLSTRDLADIHASIEDKILREEPIVFQSGDLAHRDGRLTLAGDLTIAGATRPASFELEMGADGRVSGTVNLLQSVWGIKPYRGLMGALKVRDDVDIVLDVGLPTA